ncbi:hypothetical protein [Calditerrivibrio nitroreducens]|uniref:Uncharacterized protein n=2 Tax=Calditerrivibrio nitroreducens TaxID=477976 RepID=E4THC0_CALNY|nr:hypothetical protein [Calditerrivibrio nitroreducens]ADR19855.1 hypothetical protein Calni_1959 [Calditerrivibrio nitroreducens DSM 19672]
MIKIKEVEREIDNKFKQLDRNIISVKNNFKRISRKFDYIIQELIKSNINCAKIFTKYIDPNAEFAYITKLKDGVYFAGVINNIEQAKSILQKIDIKHIYPYKDITELERDITFKDGEFFKRLKRRLEIYKENSKNLL